MANDTNDALKLHKAIPNKILNQDGTYSTFQEVFGGGSSARMQRKSVTITQNGEITIRPDTGYNGLSSVNVDVNTPGPNLQNKNVEITENRTTTIIADNGYDGLREVEVTTSVQGEPNIEFDFSIATGIVTNANLTQYITKVHNLDLSNLRSNASAFFMNMKQLTYVNPNIDISTLNSFNSGFANDAKLLVLPAFDYSHVTSIANICYGCTSLTDVPVMNLNSIGRYTSSGDAFRGCTNLTNTSLQNILKSFLTLPSNYNYNSLSHFGLTSEQATICTSFPEWTTLSANGWTTGY